MGIGIWVLGDQLWAEQAALQSCRDRQSEVSVILIESEAFVRERPYHQQKLILVWSAMRHFAEELRQSGWSVTYEIAEDFEAPLIHWIKTQGITELRVMQPNDRPFSQFLTNLHLPCELILVPNNHFLWSPAEFSQWAKNRKTLLMEYFYREGRQRYQILMEGEEPVGGKWNFDQDNRKPPKGKLNPPEPLWFEPDEMTRTVIDRVQSGNFSSYGQAEPFRWAVTRQQALQVLDTFISDRLPTFGPYQDAMVVGQETMWHALLSPYLNLGLLHPLEVIQAAEQAYYEHDLDLNCVEGFIRQILGWREYLHGLYHYVDEDYPQRNYFNHTHPLPAFFWDANQADMNCLHHTLKQVESMAYAHHIQRLMILSNFALVAGLSPQAVESWFHAAFIDAYDWVMQTNVIGMGLFADGGILATKPYASSANYINKMSDYCKGCQYDKSDRTGDHACPFNFFYWDFLIRNRDKLDTRGRMRFVLNNIEKMSAQEQQQIQQKAAEWHQHTQSSER
jgi:deoxyribodipyrimidine photolyase-related protein